MFSHGIRFPEFLELCESLEDTKQFIMRTKALTTAEFPLLNWSCDFFYIDDESLADIIPRPLVEKFLLFVQPLDIAKSSCNQNIPWSVTQTTNSHVATELTASTIYVRMMNLFNFSSGNGSSVTGNNPSSIKHTSPSIYSWLEKTFEIYTSKHKMKQEAFPLQTYKTTRIYFTSRFVNNCYLLPLLLLLKVQESWYSCKKVQSILMGGNNLAFALSKLSNLNVQKLQSDMSLERIHEQISEFDATVAKDHELVTLLADRCLDYRTSLGRESERILQDKQRSGLGPSLDSIKNSKLEKAISASQQQLSEVITLMFTLDNLKTEVSYLRFASEEIRHKVSEEIKRVKTGSRSEVVVTEVIIDTTVQSSIDEFDEKVGQLKKKVADAQKTLCHIHESVIGYERSTETTFGQVDSLCADIIRKPLFSAK
jgi:hypothetical protein